MKSRNGTDDESTTYLSRFVVLHDVARQQIIVCDLIVRCVRNLLKCYCCVWGSVWTIFLMDWLDWKSSQEIKMKHQHLRRWLKHRRSNHHCAGTNAAAAPLCPEPDRKQAWQRPLPQDHWRWLTAKSNRAWRWNFGLEELYLFLGLVQLQGCKVSCLNLSEISINGA